MTTNNSSAPVATTSTVISDELAQRIRDTFKSLHHLVSLIPNDSSPLPAFEELPTDKWDQVCIKGLNAHSRYRKAKKEEKVRAFRAGCANVVEVARGEQKKAKEEYDALSPALKAIMPKFPTNVEIPVSDFADIFPQGTSEEQMRKLLKEMSYNIFKSASGSFFVKVALTPESKDDKDAKVGVVRRPAA